MTKDQNKKLFIHFLIVISLFISLSACAQFARRDLTLIDRAKLDAKAMTVWYTSMYYSVVRMLNDPTIDPQTKHIIKKVINPKMNKFKQILITFIDSVRLAQASSSPDLVMDESKLTSLMTDIIRDCRRLGLLDKVQGVNATSPISTKTTN